MVIKTKYDIGQEVWWKYKNGEIHSGIISAIRIAVYNHKSNVGIQYGVKTDPFDADYYEWFWDFYATKEELLKSL